MFGVSRKLRPAWLLLAVVLVVGGAFVWQVWKRNLDSSEGLVFANGRIEGEIMYLASKLNGRVMDLDVEEGDTVEVNQVLATLEDPALLARLAQAKAAEQAAQAQVANVQTQLNILRQQVPLTIDRAQAEVKQAQDSVSAARARVQQTDLDAERLTRLAKERLANEQTAEQARLDLKISKSELTAAQSALIAARKSLEDAQLGDLRITAQEQALQAAQDDLQRARATVREAQSYVDDLRIRAPAKGVVVSRSVNLGEVVSAGTPLFEVVDLSQLYLRAYIPERVIGQVHLGQEARIYIDALPDPIPAEVTFIASKAEFTPREVQTVEERTKLVYAVKVQLQANPQQRVVPGLPADAAVRITPSAEWQRPDW